MCLDIYIRFFQVLYFGDSLCSDSFPANNYAGWDVVLVLEEMEAEGYFIMINIDYKPTGLFSFFVVGVSSHSRSLGVK
jgi:hypothetical protein